MTGARRKSRRAPAEERRTALVEATLSLIARHGPEAATSRAIAAEADVTQGLIRHYYGSKEDLIAEAFERHMARINQATTRAAETATGSGRDRLRAFVTASLTPPVVDARGTGIWAAFMYLAHRDTRIRETHRRSYLAYRDQLQALIALALDEAGRPAAPAELIRHAIACNAVIDGLWLEGSALPEGFSEGELPEIGLTAVGAILGLEFETGVTT